MIKINRNKNIFTQTRYVLILFFLLVFKLLSAQNIPIVISYFPALNKNATLCFDRNLDYKESWANLALRYNLNEKKLMQFNNEKSVTIKQKKIKVPLILNSNLFMKPGNQASTVYVPIYYLIKTTQKASRLSVFFKEPLLTYIKSYNKIKDHYTLNKNAPLFIGYLKVSKDYGWNMSKTNSQKLKNYNSLEDFENNSSRITSNINLPKKNNDDNIKIKNKVTQFENPENNATKDKIVNTKPIKKIKLSANKLTKIAIASPVNNSSKDFNEVTKNSMKEIETNKLYQNSIEIDTKNRLNQVVKNESKLIEKNNQEVLDNKNFNTSKNDNVNTPVPIFNNQNTIKSEESIINNSVSQDNQKKTNEPIENTNETVSENTNTDNAVPATENTENTENTEKEQAQANNEIESTNVNDIADANKDNKSGDNNSVSLDSYSGLVPKVVEPTTPIIKENEKNNIEPNKELDKPKIIENSSLPKKQDEVALVKIPSNNNDLTSTLVEEKSNKNLLKNTTNYSSINNIKTKSLVSFFKAEYEEEKQIHKNEEKFDCFIKIFKLIFDETDNKFYVLYNRLVPGSVIIIKNTTNDKVIYAKVISGVPSSLNKEANKDLVVLSELGAKVLEVSDNTKVEVIVLAVKE